MAVSAGGVAPLEGPELESRPELAVAGVHHDRLVHAAEAPAHSLRLARTHNLPDGAQDPAVDLVHVHLQAKEDRLTTEPNLKRVSARARTHTVSHRILLQRPNNVVVFKACASLRAFMSRLLAS